MLQLLAPDGTYGVPKGYEEYGKIIEALDQETLKNVLPRHGSHSQV